MPVEFNSNEYFPTQRQELADDIDKLLDDFMEPLMKETIVTEIKLIAAAANMPQSFIDGVKFVKTGPNKGEIINTWGTEEEPLAKYFNYGTTTHWIEPKDADGVLAFPATSGRNASAIYFQGSGNKQGDMLFSKGHYVSGVPRTEAMEIGFNIGKKRLATEAAVLIKREYHE